MDITRWMQEVEDEDNALARLAATASNGRHHQASHKKPTRHERRAHSKTSLYDAVSATSSRQKRHHRKPREGSPSDSTSRASSCDSSESSSSSSSYSAGAKPEETFQRRQRHATREDLYEPYCGARKRRRKAKKDDGEADKKPKYHKTERKKKRKKEKQPGHDLVKNFHAKNVSRSRLTLPPSKDAGIFNKGRASSPMRGRGLPDLVFSEMRFLDHAKTSNREARDDAEVVTTFKRKSRRDKLKDQSEQISSFFTGKPIEAPPEKKKRALQHDSVEHRAQSPDTAAGIPHVDEPRDSIENVPVDIPSKPFLGLGSRRESRDNATQYTWSQSPAAPAVPAPQKAGRAACVTAQGKDVSRHPHIPIPTSLQEAAGDQARQPRQPDGDPEEIAAPSTPPFAHDATAANDKIKQQNRLCTQFQDSNATDNQNHRNSFGMQHSQAVPRQTSSSSPMKKLLAACEDVSHPTAPVVPAEEAHARHLTTFARDTTTSSDTRRRHKHPDQPPEYGSTQSLRTNHNNVHCPQAPAPEASHQAISSKSTLDPRPHHTTIMDTDTAHHRPAHAPHNWTGYGQQPLSADDNILYERQYGRNSLAADPAQDHRRTMHENAAFTDREERWNANLHLTPFDHPFSIQRKLHHAAADHYSGDIDSAVYDFRTGADSNLCRRSEQFQDYQPPYSTYADRSPHRHSNMPDALSNDVSFERRHPRVPQREKPSYYDKRYPEHVRLDQDARYRSHRQHDDYIFSPNNEIYAQQLSHFPSDQLKRLETEMLDPADAVYRHYITGQTTSHIPDDEMLHEKMILHYDYNDQELDHDQGIEDQNFELRTGPGPLEALLGGSAFGRGGSLRGTGSGEGKGIDGGFWRTNILY